MHNYSRDNTNPFKFHLKGEPIDEPGDALIDLMPPMTEYFSSDGSVLGVHRLLDFVTRNSNRGDHERCSGAPKGFEHGDCLDQSAERLLSLPINPGKRRPARLDPERNPRGPAKSIWKATGYAGERDPVAACCTAISLRLLEPICPSAWGGRPVLWPLWADEMVHRTFVTFRLIALLMSQMRLEPDDPMRRMLHYNVASNLLAAIHELAILNDNESLPCSTVLRAITRNFVALFGSIAGDITIAIRIEPLQLAAFKRRALALLATELLSKAFLHGFPGPEGGHIEVHLARISRSRALLMIKDSRRDQSSAAPVGCYQTGNDLAGLLEAEIVQGIAGFDGTAALIDFPT